MTALLTTVVQLVITVAVVPFALVAIMLWAVGEVCTWTSDVIAIGVITVLRIGGW